jgi:putative acetyltransferase
MLCIYSLIMDLIVRQENSRDYPSTKKVNDLAFGQKSEGILVERLRDNSKFINDLSLVAELGGEIVGHILFFPIWINDGQYKHQSLALAPMSVLPIHQNKGIGGKLIVEGLKVAQTHGFKSVIVLGHEAYYPKFGFLPASNWGIKAPFDVPDNVFMAQELIPNGLEGNTGVVEYPTAFDAV